jgi:hypothetical protein
VKIERIGGRRFLTERTPEQASNSPRNSDSNKKEEKREEKLKAGYFNNCM